MPCNRYCWYLCRAANRVIDYQCSADSIGAADGVYARGGSLLGGLGIGSGDSNSRKYVVWPVYVTSSMKMSALAAELFWLFCEFV